jgi:hypothetical protein
MSANERPIFTSDWPSYAVTAHIVFWTSSALLAAGCIGGFAKLVSAQVIVGLLWIEIGAGFLLGAAAMCSGMLYVGNQVFARTPTTGWPARIAGAFVLVGTSALLFFAYGLTQVRGV